MMLRKLLLLTLFCCKSMLFSQIVVPSPSKSDFSPTLSFLASDWMEGRGTTQKGALLASEYIASMMELYQLVPYNTKSGYYQNFKIEEHTIKKAALEIKKTIKKLFPFLHIPTFRLPLSHNRYKKKPKSFLQVTD
ncbi:hypothetical protein [Flavobacterium sp. B183]|uniref:hypothetical protein n=1 Tax=Flavobacterium sp. B183 TaxID=907046 RepID=UPI00201E9966|nr:hypothetical protein [Flavobacterium sp. B183]URC12404.1 hypothetical protein M4I44_20310 [Flavobacterium sp. B183]